MGRPLTLALLMISRKNGAPRAAFHQRSSSPEWRRGKTRPFALLRYRAKRGAPRRYSSAEFLLCLAAREDAPFALLRYRAGYHAEFFV
jgi:hypothetical protein